MKQGLKILIVDDVVEIAEWLKLLIQKNDPAAKVSSTTLAIEAIRLAERERPDYVLLDEVLGTGDDFLHLLGYLQKNFIKTVLISGIYSQKPLPPGTFARLLKPDWETGKGEAEFVQKLVHTLSGALS